MALNANQRERYGRNLLVDGFSEPTQEKLLAARVAVVGAGGLGSAALGYLAAAGVGSLTLIECDTVSAGNLQRQLLYTTPEIGAAKAEAAALRLSRLNPECRIAVVAKRLTEGNAAALLAGHDVVLDCTDNYAARYAIDAYCGAHGVPMVYGTAEQMGGQVSVFHCAGSGGYRDLYPGNPAQRDAVGVLGPVAGIVGSLQALETIKLLTGIGEPLTGRLLTVDGRTLQFKEYRIG